MLQISNIIYSFYIATEIKYNIFILHCMLQISNVERKKLFSREKKSLKNTSIIVFSKNDSSITII